MASGLKSVKKFKGDATAIMNENYSIKIAGCERKLPICKINENLSIAAFIMFGDVELTKNVAQELLKLCPEYDVLITAEAKGIPLCYEMARQSNKRYVVARKSVKLYMKNALHVNVKSITTEKVQDLYLSEDEIEYVKNKRVLIVDDVISTGESLKAIEMLVQESGGNIVGRACALVEGDATSRSDLIYLGKLPIFKK